MAGGFIFEKTIQPEFQDGTDKTLLIEPNYAYQVPFTFGDDWEEIKIGMFVSYVQTGAGNENKGLTATTTLDSGGTTNDTFTYVGLIKSQDENSLPLSLNNSGFIGTQSRNAYIRGDSTLDYYNKLTHPSYGSAQQGDNKFFSTYGSEELEAIRFQESQGNFNIVGSSGTSSSNAYPHFETFFCSYWGLNYKVLNKGQSDQLVSFKASIYGANSTSNDIGANKIEDPSTENLVNIINGIGEYQYSDLHANSATGFLWNKDGAALTLPDSLFYYNAFTQVRPRIHAWAVKKIS
jgi:hypothetical protein